MKMDSLDQRNESKEEKWFLAKVVFYVKIYGEILY